MRVWGELIPIPSRVVLDLLALALQAHSFYHVNYSQQEHVGFTVFLVVFPFFLTIVTSGSLTNRWTLTFPMMPFMACLLVSLILGGFENNHSWWILQLACRVGSIVSFGLGAMLSILFPPVQLPTVNGPYQVGVVDLHLPVGKQEQQQQDHVIARILYPTSPQNSSPRIPYLNPSTALEFCKDTMAMGAPDPLKSFSFMLHNYRLISLDLQRNATPLENKFPICVYSHGLGGTNYIYSHQVMSLASHGYICLVIDHADGSAPIVQVKDGSKIWRNQQIGDLWNKDNEVDYVRARRAQTDIRVNEMLSATAALRALNTTNTPELESLGVSFVNKLDLRKKTVLMGHSFGGATAVTAGVRLCQQQPQQNVVVVAHEPAMDWAPDDARSALFASHKFKDSTLEYNGGTGGYASVEKEEEKKGESNTTTTPLDNVDMLFLYSNEWADKKWGGSHLVQCMHGRGQLGRHNSDVGIILNAKHNEFSDISMLTPLWLARRVGLTGPRNPVDTAQEIAERTRDFLQRVETQE